MCLMAGLLGKDFTTTDRENFQEGIETEDCQQRTEQDIERGDFEDSGEPCEGTEETVELSR